MPVALDLAWRASDAHVARLTTMLRTRQVYSDTAFTVRVVESVETWQSRTATGCQAAGKIEPLAVVVSGPDGEYAVDVNAEPIGAERLAQMLASRHVRNVKGR